MRLLFFSPYFHPYVSGLTTYPQKLLTYLATKHHVTALTFIHDQSLPQKESFNGINLVRMPYNFMVSKGFISRQSLTNFKQYLPRTDLVILNLPNAEGAPLAYLAHKSHLPILSIYHCQVNLGKSLPSRLINFPLNWSVNYQLSSSQQITAYTKDYVKNHPQINKYQAKINFILPPVGLLPVNQSKLEELNKQKHNQIWIGFSGRTAREKGLEYLITALSSLSPKYPLQLICAGPHGQAVAGEGDYFRKLEKQITQSGIKHRFLGTLKAGDLGAFYKAIDLLVLPSVNGTEAFGMVQVEAMLLGTPVIASDLPGVRVPIQTTGMGLVVPPKNNQKLAIAIDQILTHPQVYCNSSQIKLSHSAFNEALTYQAYDQILDQFKK